MVFDQRLWIIWHKISLNCDASRNHLRWFYKSGCGGRIGIIPRPMPGGSPIMPKKKTNYFSLLNSDFDAFWCNQQWKCTLHHSSWWSHCHWRSHWWWCHAKLWWWRSSYTRRHYCFKSKAFWWICNNSPILSLQMNILRTRLTWYWWTT